MNGRQIGGFPAGRRPAGPAAGPVALVVAAGGWLWLSGQLTGWSASGRWPRVGAGDLVGAIGRLPHSWPDPARAWAAIPGATAVGRAPAVLFYAWAVGLVGAGLGVALLGRRLLMAVGVTAPAGTPVRPQRRWGSGRGSSGTRPVMRPGAARRGRDGWPKGQGDAGWGRPRDLARIRVRRPGQPGRVVLGRPERGGGLLATEARHSVLVIGPTQSGKSSGLAIPALLEWAGPIVATSVKDDLASVTLPWRRSLGPVSVFDPTHTSGLQPLARWSPLSTCGTWSGAQRTAGWLVESTPGRRGMADAAFWYTTAAKQLAPLLLAAQRGMMSMADVVRWTDAGDFDEPLALLRLEGEDEAALALAACAGRDERLRSSVATTLETVLAPMMDPVVAASTGGTDFDIGTLLQSSGSLYLCGPSHEQSRVQGLFASLVSAVVTEAVARVSASGCPLDPPLLLVLDEAANIAPIRDLDTLASTAAGLGIQLVTVCQDLAQMAARYDPERARTIANNHRAKLILSGVCDLGTLDLVSGLAGEIAVAQETTSHDLRDGRRTRTTASVLRRLAPADQLRRVPPGHGVLIYGHLPPVRLRLRPWFADRRLRRRGAGGGADRAGGG